MKEPLRIEEVGRRELQGYERQEKRSEDLNDEEVPMIEEVERREPQGYARQEKRSEDRNDEEVPKTEEVESVQIKKRNLQIYRGRFGS